MNTTMRTIVILCSMLFAATTAASMVPGSNPIKAVAAMSAGALVLWVILHTQRRPDPATYRQKV
jgi:hypothetical protein